jgi:hypothetical protein
MSSFLTKPAPIDGGLAATLLSTTAEFLSPIA